MATSNQIHLQPEDFAIIEGLAKEISWPEKEVENLHAEIFGRLSSSCPGPRLSDRTGLQERFGTCCARRRSPQYPGIRQ
jgi:hypothetical protein